MADARPVATRESFFQTQPLPVSRVSLPFDVTYSADEFDTLRVGFIPQAMEDHWFIFYEEPWLYLHRSYSGFCIYGLGFERIGESHPVAESWASRAMQEYRSVSVEHDLTRLRNVLHGLLHRTGEVGSPTPPPART
jgi:hypothetical protein